MVHYIRFLRVPKVQLEKKSAVRCISAVLTITTDLGETFFPDDLELVVELVTAQQPKAVVNSSRVHWRKDSRVVKLNFRHTSQASSDTVRLHVAPKVGPGLLAKEKYQTAEIVDAWSDTFHVNVACSAEDLVERRFRLTKDTCVKIWEETGDSIARHVW